MPPTDEEIPPQSSEESYAESYEGSNEQWESYEGSYGGSYEESYDENYEQPYPFERQGPPFPYVSMHDILPMHIAHPEYAASVYDAPNAQASPELERHAMITTSLPVVKRMQQDVIAMPQTSFPAYPTLLHPPSADQVHSSCPTTPTFSSNLLPIYPSHSAPPSMTGRPLTPPAGHARLPAQTYRSLDPWAVGFYDQGTQPSYGQLHHGMPVVSHYSYGPHPGLQHDHMHSHTATISHGLPVSYLSYGLDQDFTDPEVDNNGLEYTSEPLRSCFCGNTDTNRMVTCNRPGHQGPPKYHPPCVGMLTAPVEGTWTCDICRQGTTQSDSTISDHSDQPSPATAPRSRRARGIVSKGAWTDTEDTLAIKLMRDLRAQNVLRRIEQLWDEISRQMQDHGYIRTPPAVKNQWNRRLRQKSGIDERVHPRPDFMQTGLLLPKETSVRPPNRLTKEQRTQHRRRTSSSAGYRKSRSTMAGIAKPFPSQGPLGSRNLVMQNANLGFGDEVGEALTEVDNEAEAEEDEDWEEGMD